MSDRFKLFQSNLEEPKNIMDLKSTDTKETQLREHVLLIKLVNLGLIDDVTSLIETFISKGIKFNINERDANGNIAVNLAAQRNDLNMLHILSKYNANLELKDYSGRTPKEWAEKNNNNEMITFIDDNLNNTSKNYKLKMI